MSEMIERVARAICKAEGMDPDGCLEGSPDWMYREAEARAAIKAMREPTDAMTKKSVDFALGVSLSGDYRWPDYMADLHRLNIDAALAERPAT